MVSFISKVALLGALAFGASAAPQGGTPPSSTAAAPSPNPTVVDRELALALSTAQRINILVPNPADASNLTFTYRNLTTAPPTGGIIALAQINNFPALALGNVAQATGFMGPCSLNVPHSHPRASEFLTVVTGGPLIAGLMLENGGPGNVAGSAQTRGPSIQLNTTLNLYQGTVFPQGLTHFQFNDNCFPTVFSAAFDNRDPGRSQLAQTFFSVRPDPLIEASLGELGQETISPAQIDTLRNQIPTAFAVLVDQCTQRCGIPTRLNAAGGNSTAARV